MVWEEERIFNDPGSILGFELPSQGDTTPEYFLHVRTVAR